MERTELEVLEYLIEKGIKNAERRLKSFLKNNKLTNKDQVTATIEDYGMFHENVRLGTDENGKILLGQNRVYVSDGEKEIPTERITGNSTNKRKAVGDVDLLKEYFFSRLVRVVAPMENGYSETVNQWAKKWIDLLPEINKEKYLDALKGVYADNERLDEEMIKKFPANVYEALRSNRRDLAIKFIEQLEAEGKIETEIEFFHKYAKDSMIVELQLEHGIEEPTIHCKVDEDRNEEVVEGIKAILEPLGVPYYRFKIVSAFSNLAKSADEKEAVECVNKWLFEEYSIDYIYNRIRIWVIDSGDVKEVSREEARRAYVDRLVNLTDDRMKRKGYKTTHKYQVALYRLNMFLLLQAVGVKNLSEQIESEMKSIDVKVEECRKQYIAKFGIPEAEFIWGFGDKAIQQQKKMVIIPDDEIGNMLMKEIEAADQAEVNEVVNADLEWLNKFSKKKPVKREISKEQQERVKHAAKATENNPYMIDIASIVEDDEPVIIDKPIESFNPFDDRVSVLPFGEPEPVIEMKVDEDVNDWMISEDDYCDLDLVKFNEHMKKLKRVNVTEAIAKTSPHKGFGWELEEKERVEKVEKEAIRRRELLHVI